MTFSFNSSIPASGNDPADDQPDMLTNFGSIASIIAVDHIGFNAAKGGLHKQVSLVNESSPALGSADAALYSNGANLYFKNSGQDTKLTGVAPTASQNGKTYLPGGLLLQWGRDTITGGATTKAVSYPTAFTSAAYVVHVTPYASPVTGDSPREVGAASITTSGFTCQSYNGAVPGAGMPFGWLAIGT